MYSVRSLHLVGVQVWIGRATVKRQSLLAYYMCKFAVSGHWLTSLRGRNPARAHRMNPAGTDRETLCLRRLNQQQGHGGDTSLLLRHSPVSLLGELLASYECWLSFLCAWFAPVKTSFQPVSVELGQTVTLASPEPARLSCVWASE